MTTHALPAAMVTPGRKTRAGNRSNARAVPRLTPNTVVDVCAGPRLRVGLAQVPSTGAADMDAALPQLPQVTVQQAAGSGREPVRPVRGDTHRQP